VVGLALALRLWPGPDRRARLAALAAVPVPAALAWFGSFLWIYGTPNPSAPYGGYTQTALPHVLPGLLGLGADQQFGLVANAPVYAVALAGTALLARRHPRLAVELVVMAGVYAVAVASYRMWWGGYSAPARFLVSVLLPAALPIAVAWQAASRALRAGIVLLIGVGGALVLGRVLVDDGKLLYNARDGYDLLLDRASRSLNLPLAFPSLHRGDVSQAAMDIAGWVAVFALAGVALAVAGRRPLSAGRAWTVAVAVAIVAGHAAGYLTWTGSQRPMGTPATSALALLHTWNPTRQPTVVRLTPTRRATADDVPQLVELATSTRGAPPSGDGPLLSVPFVPAGEYQVVATGSQRLEGTLTVTAGRTVEALERWTLDGRGAGYTGLTLDLPVLVHSITITGDEAARRTIRRLTLRPTRIIPPAGRFSTGYAVRAVRLGALRVFALDEKSFLEAGGLWTSGTHTTRLVLAHDPGAAASLSLRIGPVPAVVTARSGAWEQRWERLPGERWDVRLPEAGADGLLLELRAEPAFRPADHEPGSTDRRWLGVRLEVPRAPSLEPARVRTVPPRRSTSP
ncbi:MAG: hypothetical protein AB1635_13415, partial [Acidobacteriota bacterium]